MKLVLTIVFTGLTIMGALALLDWWRTRRDHDQATSPTRRSFARMIVAALGGVLIGSYVWYGDKKARQDLQLLFELEVLLAQLEGLVDAAIAQGEVTKLLPFMKALVSKIGEYGDKTRKFLSELERRFSPHDFADLRLGAVTIAAGLNRLEEVFAGYGKTNEIGEYLATMQKGIRRARAKTRELIDARISTY